MHRRTFEADTGTVHTVNRYERREDENIYLVFTDCGKTFEVDEMADPVEFDEDEACGVCI